MLVSQASSHLSGPFLPQDAHASNPPPETTLELPPNLGPSSQMKLSAWQPHSLPGCPVLLPWLPPVSSSLPQCCVSLPPVITDRAQGSSMKGYSITSPGLGPTSWTGATSPPGPGAPVPALLGEEPLSSPSALFLCQVTPGARLGPCNLRQPLSPSAPPVPLLWSARMAAADDAWRNTIGRTWAQEVLSLFWAQTSKVRLQTRWRSLASRLVTAQSVRPMGRYGKPVGLEGPAPHKATQLSGARNACTRALQYSPVMAWNGTATCPQRRHWDTSDSFPGSRPKASSSCAKSLTFQRMPQKGSTTKMPVEGKGPSHTSTTSPLCLLHIYGTCAVWLGG